MGGGGFWYARLRLPFPPLKKGGQGGFAAHTRLSFQRTLYLVDPAASLHTENRRLLVRREQPLLLELPAVNVDLVMLMGRNAVKPGHMALASDLMEEFRAVVVDPVLLHLCLNGGLLPEDFIERGGVYTLKPAPVKRFIRAIEVRLNTERQPPEGAGTELQDLRRLIDAQVRRLAQVYRSGDASLYAPAVFR